MVLLVGRWRTQDTSHQPPLHTHTHTHTHEQVSTTAIWDIYQRIAQEIADPVHTMLQWFEPTKAPRIDAVRTHTAYMTLSTRSRLTATNHRPIPFPPQLIYTGGGTKSAVTRMLVEGLLHTDGSGPLVNAEALSNDKVCVLTSPTRLRRTSHTHSLTDPIPPDSWTST